MDFNFLSTDHLLKTKRLGFIDFLRVGAVDLMNGWVGVGISAWNGRE